MRGGGEREGQGEGELSAHHAQRAAGVAHAIAEAKDPQALLETVIRLAGEALKAERNSVSALIGKTKDKSQSIAALLPNNI